MKKFTKILIGYIFKYLTGFLMVFICSVMVFSVAKESVERYIVKQAQMQVMVGLKEINSIVEKMELIGQMMYRNQDFYKLIYQGNSFSKSDILLFRDSNNIMMEIGYLTEYIPYMFTVFNNSDLYLSSSQCSTSFKDYYGEFMEVSTLDGGIEDSAELKEFIFQVPSIDRKFVKLGSIRYIYDARERYLEEPLVYFTSGTGTNHKTHHKFCFVLDKEYLAEAVLRQEYKEKGFLYIQEKSSEEEILAWGINKDELEEVNTLKTTKLRGYHVIKLSQDNLGWNVVTGIPLSYIDEQMKPVQNLLVGYLFIGLIAVIALTLYFSISRCNSYKQYYLQIDELKRRNKDILLENIITNGMQNSEEILAFNECFERIPEFYFVVLVRLLQSSVLDKEAVSIKMNIFLRQKNIPILINVRSGVADELFLIERFSCQETSLVDVQEAFEDMAEEIDKQLGVKFHIGISAIGTSFNNVNKCYEQAKRIVQAQYMFENENMVKVYDISANALSENLLSTEFMSRLYTILICGQEEDVLHELEYIEKYYKRMPYFFEANKEQIFYLLRNVYYTAMLQLSCKDWESHIPIYANGETCQEMIAQFQQCTKWICEQILICKKSKYEVLKKDILQYIGHHYAEPNLSAYIVGREVGITEKFFYQFWKEQMGESFSDYLLHLRIEKAKEYLSQTNYSNEQIATLVGFVSQNTFYRNFNKMVGVTPKTFKKNNIHEKNGHS